MTDIAEFLFPAPAHRSLGGSFRWWESRRLHYNMIVGSTGLFSLAVVWVVGSLPPDPVGAPPLQLVVVFGVRANLDIPDRPRDPLVRSRAPHFPFGRRVL